MFKEAYSVGKKGRLERLSRQLMKLLMNIPEKVEVETGVELIPVTKFFVKIRIINSTIKEQREKHHENKEENTKCLHNHAEGTCERDET